MVNVLTPGSRIGILGGGQLGRMLALAAARLGFKTSIYCPDEQSPAFSVASQSFCASYEDEEQLIAFANQCDVITYEFENVPSKTAQILLDYCPVYPDPKALEITQDRLFEKQFVADQSIPVAPFFDIQCESDLDKAVNALSYPFVIKTRRFGYDGKGQAFVKDEDNLSSLHSGFSGKPLIAEQYIPFEKEISLVSARFLDGASIHYDLCENIHENHILKETYVPSRFNTQDHTDLLEKASSAANKIMQRLDYIGIMTIEFFVISNQLSDQKGQYDLMVNEIAPRVHNSGHWTEIACVTDQFENHIRAIAGWPSGSSQRLCDVKMTNILGMESAAWQQLASQKNSRLHLYGKSESRPGRKMGHITQVISSTQNEP